MNSSMHGTVHVEECGPHSAREWHVWTEKADSSCTPIWATSIRAEARRIVRDRITDGYQPDAQASELLGS